MNKLIVAVGCVLCGLPLLAEPYVLSADTKIGTGEDLYLGSDAFPYDGFTFDFSSGVEVLRLVNKVNLNGKNISIKIPNDKTVYFAGGLENNVAFSGATEEKTGGEILSADTSYRGTLVISNTSVNVRTRSKYGTMTYEGGTFTLGKLQIWDSGHVILKDATVNARGTVSLGYGSLTMENCAFTKSANADNPQYFNVSGGTVYQKGGSFQTGGWGRLWIGGTASTESANNGAYVLSDGGTFRVSDQLTIGHYGKGTFTLKGGKVTNDDASNIRHYIGMNATAVGILDICGGEYDLVAGPYSANDGYACIVVGNSGTGTLKVSDGGLFTVKQGTGNGASCIYAKVIVARNSGSKGTIIVNEGGTFKTWRGPVGGEGESSFVFNGGVYNGDAWERELDAFTNFDSVKVSALGGEFHVRDTVKTVYTIPLPLVAEDPTAAAVGSFRKTGIGKLVLSGANSYKVPTVVSAGTLALATDATFSRDSALWAEADGVIDFGNTAQTVGGIGGVGTFANLSTLIVNGDIEPAGTNAVGTLTLDLAELDSGRLVIDVDEDGNCDKLVVNGDVDLSSMDLYVRGSINVGKVLAATRVLTATGTISGRFRSVKHDKPGHGCAVTYEADGIGLGQSGLALIVR